MQYPLCKTGSLVQKVQSQTEGTGTINRDGNGTYAVLTCVYVIRVQVKNESSE